MTTKRNILTLLIMFSLSLGIFANGNGEKNQYSSTLKIGEAEFSVLRETKLGSDLISIVNDNGYYIKEFNIPNEPEFSNIGNYSYNGNNTNTNLISINSFSYTGTTDKNSIKQIITVPYNSSTTSIGILIINRETPSQSYKIILEIIPNLIIPTDGDIYSEMFEQVLIDDPVKKRYLKTQVLGSNSFIASEANPFPISEIKNEYSYHLRMDDNSQQIKDNEKVELGHFDSIYNASNFLSTFDAQDSPMFQAFLTMYYNNGKPLFHHYINRYMEQNGHSFDYREYVQITPEEGKELVNKALRYLTWGLEYTPDVNKRALNTADNIYPSQLLDTETNLQKWIMPSTPLTETGDELKVLREKNYFDSDLEEINEVVNDKDPTYDQNKINELKALAGDYFVVDTVNPSGLGLTTPFVNGSTPVVGSSLPYVEGGMDSPRTFNYKMKKQFDIVNDFLSGDGTPKTMYGSVNDDGTWDRNDYFFTTKSNGEHKTPEEYYFCYLPSTRIEDYVDLNTQSPFMPGRKTDGKYKGLNLTGVDSLGLLSGALSMTGYYNKVLGLTNRAKSQELDKYYNLKSGNSVFHNVDGYPEFYSDDFDDSYTDNYEALRFNRFDLERSTIIVPNLNEMRSGDLLVNTTNGKTELAIVVDTGYSVGDDSFNMANVLVLSVNNIDKRVALNYWGNGATYSSFTDRPKDYIVRRLIKFNGSDVNNPGEFGTDDAWDPFSAPRDTITTKINFKNSVPGHNNSRWIPNTGEVFHIYNITFQEDGYSLSESNIPVIFNGLIDTNYETSGDGHDNTSSGNNILVNKGDGFEFFAYVKTTGTENPTTTHEYIKLATLNLNTSSQSENDRYIVEYDNVIFNADGTTKDGFEFYYNGDCLAFSYGDNDIYQFGIRPLENNIRPGDDILLNFDLLIDNELVHAPGIDDDILSVYDEKMIWRANLYIKEDSNDWNDNNPWDAPSSGSDTILGDSTRNFVRTNFIMMEKNGNSITTSTDDTKKIWYGNNEWNKVYDFDKLVNEYHNKQGEFDINRSGVLDDGNGTQGNIAINSSTWSYNNSNGVDQENRVAYDWNGMDGPFEFNFKTDNQKKLLEHYFKKDKEYVAAGTDTLGDDIDLWDNSLAPDTNHSNYIHSSTKYTISVLGSYATLDGSFKDVTGEYDEIDNKQYYAYLPSLSNNVSKQFDGGNAPSSIAAGHTAGTDCIGFAKNSASYENNNYKNGNSLWGNVIPKMWGSERDFTRYPYYHELSYLITKEKDKIPDGVDALGKPKFKYPLANIKVGDIIYYCKSNSIGESDGSHIMIISEITDTDGNIEPDEVVLIESTDGRRQGQIENEKDLNDLNGSQPKNWYIVRLRNE